MISLTPQQYEALLAWASPGAEQDNQADAFILMRRQIDRFNSISRFTYVIRFDTLPQRAPTNPDQMPQGSTKVMELPRRGSYEDVKAALAGERYDEAMVYVTADPNGRVGWYQLSSYPWV